jgi:hypothetical protein
VLPLLVAVALLTPYGDAEELLRLPEPIVESSGLASSSVSDDWLFTHQDSGDQARFYAVSRQGQLLATYALPGVQARDWEDMARGPDEQGSSSLWLGDIGDNDAGRDRGLLVHRVPEPSVDPAMTGRTVDTAAPTSFRLSYDDGPRDAEALLVHPRTGRVYVVSKELFGPPGLYAAPERLDPDGPNPLRRVAEFDVRGPVTAGDLSPDGNRLALRTYTDLYEWSLEDDDVAGAAQGTPTVTALPATEQGEGLAYSRDGSALLVSSEGERAPVHRVALGAPAAATPPAGPPAAAAPDEEGRVGVRPVLLLVALAVALALALAAAGWRLTRRRHPA